MKELLPRFESPPQRTTNDSDPKRTAVPTDFESLSKGMEILLAEITPRPSPWFDIGVIIGEFIKSAFLIPKLAFDLLIISLTDSEEESVLPPILIERRLSWKETSD